MSNLTKNDEQLLAAMYQMMDRYCVGLAAPARGDTSLSMTKEFKQELVETTRNLPRYKISDCPKKTK